MSRGLLLALGKRHGACFPPAIRALSPVRCKQRWSRESTASLPLCFPRAPVMKINAKTIAQLPTSPDQHKADVIYFDDDMPGFGIRFRRSGDRIRKSWVVQYRHAGATRRMLLGSDVLGAEQARAAAKKLLAKVALGEDPQGDKTERRHRDTHTLLALVTDYVAWKEGTAARPATMSETRRYLLDARDLGALHGMPLDRVARRDVAAQILRIAKVHGAVTSSRARTCLSSAFTWAMQNGLAEMNPVVGTLAPQGAKPRERVLDDGELAAVWREAGDDDFGRIVRLLMLTGQRRTEVGAMTHAEVDRDRCTWTIPAGRTKNGRTHTLPLSALAMSVIESVPERVG